jgi:Lectin C-type domain/PEP-CTERM motif
MKSGMMLGAAVVGVGLLAGQAMALNAAPFSIVEGPITNPANGHQYEVIGSSSGGGLDWLTAEADAELLGGHLTTINDAAENAWIVSNLAVAVPGGVDLSHLPLWIGYSDPTHDAGGGSHAGNFVWADGDPSTFTSWDGGEPNDNGGNEFYAAINWGFARPGGVAGTWNDTPEGGSSGFGGTSDGPYFGIVEIAAAPEPASLGVLGLGAVALMGRRRR